jgi:NOL1/NOP2/sun family putative RNA methylase
MYNPDFIKRYSRLTNWNEFSKYLQLPLRKSIRVNTLKISVTELTKKLTKDWHLESIPWCDYGFWISPKKTELSLGSTREHKLGYFYIQEAASMIPVIVLDPKPGETILDMCASPGGKTTQIAQHTHNTGKLIANDIREDRIAILKRNIARMGVNCTLTKQPGQWFKDIKFDKILIDAPCSGTGTLHNIENYTPAIFKRIANTQKSLLHHAYCVLKKNGIMVYSTCSLEPEENEAVIDWLLHRHKKTEIENINININRSPPVMEFEGINYDTRIKNCLRIWPQDNNTSGFFVAKIKKVK